MSDKTDQRASGGIGFLGLLAIVFITLKLTHVVTWSWLWVLAPLWAPLAIFAAIAVVVIIALIIAQARGDNPFR